ncbi:MAG: hypothetical protein K0S65_5947, partial [Labilithrix sp.]|nr:hypothetical protein [Labilithrix sp.]
GDDSTSCEATWPAWVPRASVDAMGKPTLVLLFLLLAAMFVALTGACDEDTTRPAILANGPAQPGLGGSGGGGNDGGLPGDASLPDADGGACTDLESPGGVIGQNAINDELPAGTGGTVTDGVYNLTDARVYQGLSGVPGVTGASYKGSVRITGPVFERVLTFTSASGASSEVRSRGTFTVTGINGTIVLECPSPIQEQVTYTATTDSLTLANLVTKELFIFTKQP